MTDRPRHTAQSHHGHPAEAGHKAGSDESPWSSCRRCLTRNGEGECDQGPDDDDDADGAEGQGCRGPVHDGHRVQHGEGDQHGAAEERHRQHHIPDLQNRTEQYE